MPTLCTRLTEVDLDKRIADKAKPLTCTGNCNQGRACDCVADVEAELTPAQVQYLRVITYIGSPLFVVGVIALAALYLR